jgi:urease accessory protein
MNLRLLQITDSALPIGGYTHSWGLEAALARGLVRDVESLERWVRAWLRFSLAPLEGVVVSAVWRACASGDDLLARKANDLVRAGLVPPSLRGASREMGEHLLALATTWTWSRDRATALQHQGNGWHHAVVFGFLGAAAGASPGDTLTAYLHQAVLGMIGAGVRAVAVGHTHGQQVLAYLHADVEELAESLAGRDLSTAGSGCPFYEVLCDEQTRLYTRLFRS